jgi:hypothetical protein
MKTQLERSSRKSIHSNRSRLTHAALRLCLALLGAGPLATLAQQPACVSAPPGLIGWWRGEGNGNDSAGTNNAYSMPHVYFTNGVVGEAFAFDPENQPYGTYTGVRIADQPDYVLTNSLSIEAWIRPRGDGYVIFYRGDNRSGLDPYTMSMGLNNILSFGITDANGNSAGVSTPIAYNQWWHVAGTLDGASGNLSLYTNGTLAAQITTTVRPLGNLIPQDSPGIGIGNVNDGFNNFPFRGDIDEVSLYNRALSALEIQAIYNADGAGKCRTPVPPAIVSQPASQTALVGDTVNFAVTATGDPPLSYQWRMNGADLTGQTTNSLTLNNVQPTNAGSYSVFVTNEAGTALSSNALLVVNPRPPCTVTPPGVVGWWRGEGNGNDSVGTNNAYALPNVSFTTGIVGQAFAFDPENLPYGSYSGVRIADQPSYALTNALTIEGWIRPRGDGYVIFYRGDNRPGLDPYTLSMGLNNILSFGITDANGNSASVSAPLIYNQWWHVAGTLDGASGNLSLYTNGSLAAQITTTVRPLGNLIPQDSPGIGIGNVNDGRNNFPFRGDIDEISLYNRALSGAEIAAICNADGSGKCQEPPSILVQPASQMANETSNVTFTVTAAGTPQLRYQWYWNGTNIAGATSASLTLVNVQVNNAGSYSVRVINDFGSVISSDAMLAVNRTPVAQCANVIVSAGANCQADASINNGSFDPDGDPITLTQAPPGPYPLGTNRVTLTVTDSHGASNSCSALVIVLDRTPPVLSCPGGKVLEFQDEKGTVATYSVTATDSCSAVSLSVTPPSGSLFPIGVTPVLVRATDTSGNSAQCSFDVTVLGARGVKSNVLAQLVTLRQATATNRVDCWELSEAIEDMIDALGLDVPGAPRWVQEAHRTAHCERHHHRLSGPLWLDETHIDRGNGWRVFAAEQDAVWELVEILWYRRSGIPDAVTQDLIDRLVKCDRLLAVVSIQDAARAGANTNKIARLLHEVGLGDQAAAAHQPVLAVEHYWQAWMRVGELKLASIAGTADGKIQVQLPGNAGGVYAIQASTNMVDWVTVGTCTADAEGNLTFTDPDASKYQRRFYRAVQQ